MKSVAIAAGFALMAAAGTLFFVLHSQPHGGTPAAIAEVAARAQQMAGEGHFAEARDLLRESLRQLDREQPTAESAAAFDATLSALAMVEVNLEHWPDAETYARRQIALAEGPLVHSQARADYVDLGAALYGKGDRAGAEAAYDKAIAAASSQEERANAHLAIAFYYHKHRDEKPAIDHAQKGSVIAERVLGVTDPTTLTFELALAKILLADGQRELALPTAEKILPNIEKGVLGPLALGDARFAVARALPDNERPRARQLAAKAQQALAEAGHDGAEHAQEVAKWLVEHLP
jgi:tetratricopeptide (TPR) repeat protein